jgi:hypothetical protein
MALFSVRIKHNMSFQKEIKKVKLLASLGAFILLVAFSAVYIIQAATVEDDFSGSSNLAELLGSEVTGGELINEDIQSGNVLSFGSGDYVSTTNVRNFGIYATQTTSISFWAKGAGAVISNRRSLPHPRVGHAWVRVLGDGTLEYRVESNSSSPYIYTGNSTLTSNTDEWNHYAIVIDSVRPSGSGYYDIDLTYYINGQKETETLTYYYNGATIENYNVIDLGRFYSYTYYTHNYAGEIAQVRMFSDELTDAEVLDLYHYNYHAGGNLVAYWKLDGDANDYANSYNGIVNGADWIDGSIYNPQSRTTSEDLLAGATSTIDSFAYTTSKKPGGTNARVQFSQSYDEDRENVIEFDGTSSYVTVADDDTLDFGTGDFTISLWAKGAYANQGSGWNMLFSKGEFVDVGAYSICYISDNILRFRGEDGVVSIISSATLLSNEFQHIVVTRVGEAITMYVNGENVGDTTSSYNFTNSEPLYIGKDGFAVSRNMTGSVADMRIYSEGLSSDEIVDLYKYGIEPDTTNLQAHWKLDGDADDSSGKGNNGSMTGVSWTTDQAFANDMANWRTVSGDEVGNVGSYGFDGTNDSINVGHDTGFDGNNMTYAFWIKANTADMNDSSRAILDKANFSIGSNDAFYINFDDRDSQSRTNAVGASFDKSGGAADAGYANNIAEDGKWVHVVITYDAAGATGQRVLIYKNGQNVPTVSPQTGTGSHVTNTQNLYIGDRNVTTGNEFDGSISDVRIYSETMSAPDIWNLYAYSTEPDDTNLEGHWKFNGNALDSSGNGNDGSVSGAINTTDWNEIPHVGHSLLTDDDTQVSSFDGVNNYAELSTVSNMDSSDSFTVSAWFNADTIDGVNQNLIFSQWNGSAYVGLGLNAGNLAFGVWDSDWTSASYDSFSSTGTWHHVVGVWNGSAASVFVDGVEYSGTNVPGGDVTNVETYIGRRNDSLHEFHGQISNVAIFDDVLTDSEVETLYQQGYVPTNHEHLVSYWPLAGDYENKEGTSALDGTCSTYCPTTINDIYRPQPEEPTQITLDLTSGFATSSPNFFYRTFFTTDDGSASYALGEVTLEYTEEGASGSSPTLEISSRGIQTESATTTTGIELGGVFVFDSPNSTTTIESINISQNGTLAGSYITDVTLEYAYSSTSTEGGCAADNPGVGLTSFGTSDDLTNGTTTISGDLEVSPGNVGCVYVTYSLDDAEEYSEIGKTIDLGINATSSVAITEEGVTISLDSEPSSPFGYTTLSQNDVQTLTLLMPDGSETLFYVQDGVLFKKEGDADAKRLTSRDVEVVYADFENLTDSGERGQVRITLRLKFTGQNYVGSEVIQEFVTTVNVGR